MKPVEFVLWLNGAAELVGDQPPTPEQWATIREKLGEVVGGLVAARLLERAEETLRVDERRKKGAAERVESMKQALESMNNQRTVGNAFELAGYQMKMEMEMEMEMRKAQIDAEAQKVFGLANNALPASTIFDVPEMPKPHNPGLLNRILGKATP